VRLLIGFRIVLNQEIVLSFSFHFQIDLLALEDIIVQVINVFSKEGLDKFEVILFIYGQANSSLFFEVLTFVIDVFLLEVFLERCFEHLHVLDGGFAEVDLTDLQLEMRWFWIASFMEGVASFIWIFGSRVNRFQELKPFNLCCSSHVMTLIGIEVLEFIYFIVGSFKFDLLPEEVDLRGISLLHDNLHDILSFKFMILQDWNELNNNLHRTILTSCLLLRSTFGYIFSMRCFMNNLKLSISFLSRKTP
jgi:hypothetical protein